MFLRHVRIHICLPPSPKSFSIETDRHKPRKPLSSRVTLCVTRTLLINLLDEIPDTWPILVVSTWDTCLDDDDEFAAEDLMQTDKGSESLDPLGRGSSSNSSGEFAIDSDSPLLKPGPKPKMYLNHIQVHRVRLPLVLVYAHDD